MTIIFIFAGTMLVFLVFIVILTIFAFRSIKKKVNDKIPKIDETEYLLQSYRKLKQEDIEAFHQKRINLTIMKKKKSDNSGYDVFFKVITPFISIIGLIITLTQNTFNDSMIDIYDKLMDIFAALLILISFSVIISRVFATYSSKTNDLISQHLIIMDEVAKEPESDNINS